MTLLWVLVAGGLGAAARYLVERAVSSWAGSPWPWGTFAVNVSGCLLAGLLTGATGLAGTVAGTGFVGSYTTFSAYAVEVVKVDGQESRAAAAAYALGSLGLGVLAAGLGIRLAGL